MPHHPRGRRRLLAVALGLVALAGTTAGCGPGAPPTVTTPTEPTPTSDASTAPADAPPGIPVRGTSPAAVAAVAAVVAPVSLAIRSVGIDVPVDPVGAQPDGQMEIPPLAERAGWYRFGAAPGQAVGTAVIAAHVDSIASAGVGPFVRLKDAAVGDVVDVVLQDGSALQYAVSSVVRVAKPDVSWPDVFTWDGPHRLVLVTCGGTFQRRAGHYSDNVIVTADPVGG